MATKTSIYLPDEDLVELAQLAPQQLERSNLVAGAVQYFFNTPTQQASS